MPAVRHRASLLAAAAFALGCFSDPPSVDGDEQGGQCPAIEVPEPQDLCPAICNGECADNECQIICRADTPCDNRMIECPPDYACDIDCAGDGVCASAMFTCPSDFACSLTCEGANACASAELSCGFSECSIECGAGDTACMDTIVHCGEAACLADCATSVLPVLDMCEDSCNCGSC